MKRHNNTPNFILLHMSYKSGQWSYIIGELCTIIKFKSLDPK